MPAKIKTPEENPLYVQLTYEESLYGKKQVLYSETSILKLLRILQTYRVIRAKEIKKKLIGTWAIEDETWFNDKTKQIKKDGILQKG